MVCEVEYVILTNKGLINNKNFQKSPIKKPVVTKRFYAYLDELDEYELPEKLVKVTQFVLLDLNNRLGMSEELLNFIFELDKKCDEGVELLFKETQAFTQSDWDLFIENVVNNPSLKFGECYLMGVIQNDITFNLNTDRRLYISNYGNGLVTLKGKMDVVQWASDVNELNVEGEFKDIVDVNGNSLMPRLYDYDNLPDLYEGLESRLRRLVS